MTRQKHFRQNLPLAHGFVQNLTKNVKKRGAMNRQTVINGQKQTSQK
jgi:hypothetical protein